MKKLINYLNNPFPTYEEKRWRLILIASLLVFMVLAIFILNRRGSGDPLRPKSETDSFCTPPAFAGNKKRFLKQKQRLFD